MQRQVGEDHAVAIGQRLDDRLELAVAEQRGVQEHEARAAARLAVGHARAVGVVVEAQLHPVRLPGALPAASAAAMRAPAPSSTAAERSMWRCSSAWMPAVRFAPRRAAPTR